VLGSGLYLVAELALAEVDRHIYSGFAEVVGKRSCAYRQLRSGNRQINRSCRRIGRYKATYGKEVADSDIAHAKAHPWQRLVVKQSGQVVVTAAAEARAVLLLVGIKDLKNNARVV